MDPARSHDPPGRVMSTPDPFGQPEGPQQFDFTQALAALASGADNVAGPKVEPSAQHRATARDVAQQFAAYRDEGFTRAEAIHLATLGTQIAVRVMCEEHARKQNGDQT